MKKKEEDKVIKAMVTGMGIGFVIAMVLVQIALAMR